MQRSGQQVGGIWRDVNRQGGRGRFHGGEIIAGRDAIETRIPRILLGGATGMQLAQPSMEYDMTQAYPAQTWVHVGADNDAVTEGTIDPHSGLQVNSVPGWYCSGPNGVPLTTEDGSPAYNIPQSPSPDESDIDSDLNFWVIFVPEAGPDGFNFYIYDNSDSYSPGNMVRVASSGTIGDVTLTPGTYLAVEDVPGGGTGNEVPQYPEPSSGTIYWRWVGFGPQVYGVCSSSGTETIYVQGSSPL